MQGEIQFLMMHLYIIAFALTGITALLLGTFVLSKNSAAAVNKSWFTLSLSVFVYSIFFCFHVAAPSQRLAIIYSKILSVGSITATPLFLLFVCHLTKKYQENKRKIYFIFALSPVFFYALLTDKIYSTSEVYSIFNYYVVPGVMYPAFVTYFVAVAILSHVILVKSLRTTTSSERIQIKYVLFASCIAFFAAATTFITPYKNTDAIMTFSLLLPLYPVIVSYAIVKHQLMDIEVIIRRTAIFSGLFAFVYGIFTAGTMVGQEFFKNNLHWNQWIAIMPTMITIKTLPQLAGFITNIFLCYFVWRRRSSPVHLIYSLFSLCVAIWTLGSYLLFFDISHSQALFIARALHIGVLFLPALFFHFICLLLDLPKWKRYLVVIYGFSFIFFILDVLGILIRDVRSTIFGFYAKGGAVYGIFSFFVTAVIMTSLVLVLRAMRDSDPSKKKQLRYLAFGTSLALLGGLNDFLPINGIYKYPILNIFVYPFGSLAIGIYGVCVAYSIARYNLMDLKVIIKRTAVFAGLFAFVYGTFTIVTMVGQEFFKGTLHWNQWIAMVPTVAIITFALRPLEVFLTNATEKFLFQKRYDYRELLRTFTNEVLTVLDLQKLMDQTIAGLMRIVKLESAAVFLKDKDAKVYRIFASSGVQDKNLTFKDTDRLITHLSQTHEPLLKDKEADKMSGVSNFNDDFKKLNAQLCLPIALHDELTGVLCLGMKKSGEEFMPEDIDILMTLARTLAIALANAQLFDQLSKTQDCMIRREKMAAVGTLAAGMAHEIKNPLAAIQTFTEYLPAKYTDPEFREKFVRIVGHEVDRIHNIVKNLLLFSKPSEPNKKLCSVNEPLKDILDLLSNEFLKKNIHANFHFEEHQILADSEQLKQALLNVVLNAVDAMKESGGTLDVRTIATKEDMEVLITDTGCGISKENIPHLFDPFYTNKEGGTGLGLSITHSIVEKNGGKISVESQVGVGTTFTLSFPMALVVKGVVV